MPSVIRSSQQHITLAFHPSSLSLSLSLSLSVSASMSTSPTQKDETSTNPDAQPQPPFSDPPITNHASSPPQQPPPPTAVTDSSPEGIGEPKSVGDSPATENAADDSIAMKSNGANNDDVTVSDTQKKMRRAERFGVPVNISEEEKRNSRAERFGTGSESSVHGSDALTKLEDQKRKARGERFGSVQSVPADEEAKKKARLSRFTAVPQSDPLEEEKKKARALRFSQAPSASVSQVNGKANDIETKTAIIGKVGGKT